MGDLRTQKEYIELARKLSLGGRVGLLKEVDQLRFEKFEARGKIDNLLTQADEKDKKIENLEGVITIVKEDNKGWLNAADDLLDKLKIEKDEHEKTKIALEESRQAHAKTIVDMNVAIDQRNGYCRETLSLKDKILNLEDLNTKLQKSEKALMKQVENLCFMAKKLKVGWMKAILNQ